MRLRTVAALLWLGAALGGAGCGGTTSVTPPDGPQRDVGSHEDGPAVDAGADAGDAAIGDGGGDALSPDSGPRQATRFLSGTSGGGLLLGPHYRLELFVGPAQPVGAGASPSYRLQLGPGALRNAR